jgi:hypothetical protein
LIQEVFENDPTIREMMAIHSQAIQESSKEEETKANVDHDGNEPTTNRCGSHNNDFWKTG